MVEENTTIMVSREVYQRITALRGFKGETRKRESRNTVVERLLDESEAHEGEENEDSCENIG